MKLSWIALIYFAVLCVCVLGAGCGSDSGCCATCSPPAGACGDPLPRNVGFFDAGGADGMADATGEQ